MRSVSLPVIVVATLLVGFSSAAPAATRSTSSSSSAGTNIILVPTALTCGTTTTTASSASATPVSWTPATHHQKACDNATFSEANKDDPVTPADWKACAALYSQWASFNGTFNIGSNSTANGDGTTYDYPSKRAAHKPPKKVSYVPILRSDSCTFGLHSGDLDKLVALGDVDISFILKSALNEHSTGSLLGVRGGVNCAVRGAKGEKAALKWQLYYPGA